jgi:hypothetical protein
MCGEPLLDARGTSVWDVKNKLSTRDFLKAGRYISGGFGFWAHSALATNPELADAWIEALRQKGYSDLEIVLYGDFKDGRMIGDELEPDDMTKEKAIQIIKKRSISPKEVRRIAEGEGTYQNALEDPDFTKFFV